MNHNITDLGIPAESELRGIGIIRCVDDLQYIVQGQQGGRWRNATFHFGKGLKGWASIHYRHGMSSEFESLPDQPPPDDPLKGYEASVINGEDVFEMFLNGELDET